jgi:hypothetical protein
LRIHIAEILDDSFHDEAIQQPKQDGSDRQDVGANLQNGFDSKALSVRLVQDAVVDKLRKSPLEIAAVIIQHEFAYWPELPVKKEKKG